MANLGDLERRGVMPQAVFGEVLDGHAVSQDDGTPEIAVAEDAVAGELAPRLGGAVRIDPDLARADVEVGKVDAELGGFRGPNRKAPHEAAVGERGPRPFFNGVGGHSSHASHSPGFTQGLRGSRLLDFERLHAKLGGGREFSRGRRPFVDVLDGGAVVEAAFDRYLLTPTGAGSGKEQDWHENRVWTHGYHQLRERLPG